MVKKFIKKIIPIEIILKIIRGMHTVSYFCHKDNRSLFLALRAKLKPISLIQLLKYVYISPGFNSFAKAYLNPSVKLLNENWKSVNLKEPIFICAVKNDLIRIQLQLEHYRKINIQHIVYIDNGSTDGTFEYLNKQPDVNLFTTSENFNASIKDAWIRQVMDYYGYDRWYLIVDSDELFIYPHLEKVGILKLIDILESRKEYALLSMMLDMYTKNTIFDLTQVTDTPEDIVKQYSFFDTDSYVIKKDGSFTNISGGPRERIFSKNKEFKPLLTKYPLIKMQRNSFYGYHWFISKNKLYHYPLFSALLHYKFLPIDNIKYVKIVKEGTYAGGSAEYRQYLKVLEKEPNQSFYYENSCQLTTSWDLSKIKIFKIIEELK